MLPSLVKLSQQKALNVITATPCHHTRIYVATLIYNSKLFKLVS